jgi:hypothetical protein
MLGGRSNFSFAGALATELKIPLSIGGSVGLAPSMGPRGEPLPPTLGDVVDDAAQHHRDEHRDRAGPQRWAGAADLDYRPGRGDQTTWTAAVTTHRPRERR